MIKLIKIRLTWFNPAGIGQREKGQLCRDGSFHGNPGPVQHCLLGLCFGRTRVAYWKLLVTREHVHSQWINMLRNTETYSHITFIFRLVWWSLNKNWDRCNDKVHACVYQCQRLPASFPAASIRRFPVTPVPKIRREPPHCPLVR